MPFPVEGFARILAKTIPEIEHGCEKTETNGDVMMVHIIQDSNRPRLVESPELGFLGLIRRSTWSPDTSFVDCNCPLGSLSPASDKPYFHKACFIRTTVIRGEPKVETDGFAPEH